jgi:PEP-CTERM motif
MWHEICFSPIERLFCGFPSPNGGRSLREEPTVKSLVTRTALIAVVILAAPNLASAKRIRFVWPQQQQSYWQNNHYQNWQNQRIQPALDQTCYACGIVEQSGTNASVPEPGTLALFGAALFGWGVARRRRKPNP